MARAQDRIKHFVDKQSWTDNARLTFNIPRDFDLETLVISVAGTSTLTSAGAAVRAEAPLQAFKFITLKANGSDVLDGISGIMAHRLGAFRKGQLGPLVAPSDATAAARTFSGSLMLDRAIVDGIRPKDANFPTRGLSTFVLELQMGAAADLFTGTPVGAISAATVTVSAYQMVEKPGADGKRALPRVVTKRTQATFPLVSTNANAQFRLNTGNLLRGLVMRAYGSTTAGEPANAGINNVKIMQGNQVVFDEPWSEIRAMNAADLSITSLPTGLIFIDFMNMGGVAGKLADCLDMTGGEEINLFLDVTGATNNAVDVVTLEYMPYNPKYWGIQQ